MSVELEGGAAGPLTPFIVYATEIFAKMSRRLIFGRGDAKKKRIE